MNPIEFIRAGAGSGKTYRLTELLSESLESGQARPAAILATTFTVKAAAELRQRSRKWLLGAGRLDLATAIGQARIGTVNSVCGQLLKRYCFELGLSPDQTVLSQSQVNHLLHRAVDDVLDDTTRGELITLSRRFAVDDEDLLKPVGKVMEAARSNGLLPDALRTMGKTNADLLLAHWPKPRKGTDFTKGLHGALTKACDSISSEIEKLEVAGERVLKKTMDARAQAQELASAFAADRWTWSSWLGAAALDPGAKLMGLVEDVVQAAAAHEYHPQFHADVRRYLDIVFGIAADALAQYDAIKRDAGVLDFIDQETLVLKALQESEEVRASFAGDLDLVLVDEFQDTSPLQLALFVELAKLAKRSVWVGDPKQAIYGFRGTDATLFSAIVQALPGWGGTFGAPLETSRRSVPALVELTNAVFIPAFSESMSEDSVKLKAHRKAIPKQPSLLNWTFTSSKNEMDFVAIGQAVAELIASDIEIADEQTGASRRIQPGDIAVLCRQNVHVKFAAASLAAWGIPTASATAGLLATPEASLVVACLRRMQDPSDTLASAIVVSLADCVDTETWLQDRLAYLKAGGKPARWRLEGEGAHALLLRLEVLRGHLRVLTPAEALRLAAAESHVAVRANQWSHNPKEASSRIANVEALLAMGRTYEEECVSAKKPATVSGLLQWLTEQAGEGVDMLAASVGGAVEVMTHHGAKGLEWPVVILTGLGEAARSAVWDVRARTEGVFDAQEPLRHRFVHFWFKPYGKRKLPQPALNAEASEIGQSMQRQALDESRRLLYVSFTRARDVLVLTSSLRKNARAWVDETQATSLVFGDSGPVSLPGKVPLRRFSRVWSSDELSLTPPKVPPADRWWFRATSAIEAVPMWVQPSSATDGQFAVSEVENVGTRIAIASAVDMASLGTALHNCIACTIAGGVGARDMAVDDVQIASILSGWGVDGAVQLTAVTNQLRCLAQWLKVKWPGAKVRAEVPIEVEIGGGRWLRGQIDLLVETAHGWIVIDHKADPRSARADERTALAHGPQLAAYADGLQQATGKAVLETWLFMPVAAQAVRIERVLQAA